MKVKYDKMLSNFAFNFNLRHYMVAALQPLNAAVFVGDGVLQGAADFDYLALAMAAAAAPALGSLAVAGANGKAVQVDPRLTLLGFNA